MIEMMTATGNKNVAPVNQRFTFTGEPTGPTYAAMKAAMAITGGSNRTENTWLGFTETSTGYQWKVAKIPPVYSITMAVLQGFDAFNGKVFTVAGVSYYSKSIAMTSTGSFATTDIANGGTTTASASTVFADSDFNHIFYPIISSTGTSPEGITYGSQASYAQADLGFQSGNPNSTIGSEENANGYHIVINQVGTTRFSRTGSSASWGWRPMIREIISNFPFAGSALAATYTTVPTIRGEIGYCGDSTGSNIWLMGGTNGSTYLQDFWTYSKSSDSWTQLTTFPGGLRQAPALCYVPTSNSVYSFGGSSATPALSNQKNDLYRYDISTNTWSLITPTSSLPAAATYANLDYYNGKLYLYGGYNVATTWSFDLTTLVWTQLSSSPYNKRIGSSTAMVGANIYAVGLSGTTYYLMKYNILTGSWSVENQTSCVLGRLTVYKGDIISLGFQNGVLYRYYMNEKAWEQVSTLSSYLVDTPLFVGTSDFIYSVYGRNSSGTSINLIYKIT